MQYKSIRRWSLRVALAVAGLLVLAVLAAWLFLRGSLARLDGTRMAPGLAAPVTVERDDRGVPVISGRNRLDVAYATGFVHAQDRFFQMDLLRRVAAGELAELFGPRALGADREHRLHRFRARAELAVRALAPADRRFLERYVAGVNDGLQDLAARPFEYALLGVRPRAWSGADSLLVVWAMYFDLQGNQAPRKLARGWLREHSDADQLAFLLPESTQWDTPLDAGAAAPARAIPATAPAWWGRPRARFDIAAGAAEFSDAVGSNNWAIAGSRSKDGAAIVSDDMHLNIQLPNTWYRAVLRFPDASGAMRRVVGVTLPGTPPVIVAGSNGRVAWGFTNSNGDYLDLIAAGTDAARPGQVRLPGGWERPAGHEERILVKGAPAQRLLVRETSLGPLIEAAGRAYAIHWAAHAAGAVNIHALRLESADTLGDALAIAATMGIPAQNFVAGDALGHIGWTIAGPLPRRAQGGWASTFPLAPGGPPAWDGYLAPAQYPQVRDPAGGQLHTANSRPLLGEGAALLGDGGFDLGARARQVRDGLTALGAHADVNGAHALMLDDRALFMSGWRARAIAALDADALAGQPRRAQLLQLLQSSWSGHASVDSVAYRIARAFLFALYDELFDGADGELARLDAKASVARASARWPAVIARLLDEQSAAWLPARHASWRALQLAALDRVSADLTKDGAPMAAATWGERNSATIAHPISAAVPLLRRWLAVPRDMQAGDIHMPRVAGPAFGQSERMTVSPGKEEQGLFAMPGGQSGHPLSPYFLAGHEEWVAGRATSLLPGPPRHTLTFVR